jgi:hypothetical protein
MGGTCNPRGYNQPRAEISLVSSRHLSVFSEVFVLSNKNGDDRFGKPNISYYFTADHSRVLVPAPRVIF